MCVRACIRACVCACACACVRVCACVCVCVVCYTLIKNGHYIIISETVRLQLLVRVRITLTSVTYFSQTVHEFDIQHKHDIVCPNYKWSLYTTQGCVCTYPQPVSAVYSHVTISYLSSTTLTQAHLLLVPTCALSIHGEDLVSNLHPLHPSPRHKHSCAAQSHCLHPQAPATSRGTQLYLPRLMAIPSVHSLVRGNKQRMET